MTAGYHNQVSCQSTGLDNPRPPPPTPTPHPPGSDNQEMPVVPRAGQLDLFQ